MFWGLVKRWLEHNQKLEHNQRLERNNQKVATEARVGLIGMGAEVRIEAQGDRVCTQRTLKQVRNTSEPESKPCSPPALQSRD